MAKEANITNEDLQLYWDYRDHPDRQKSLLREAQNRKGQSIGDCQQPKEDILRIHETNLGILERMAPDGVTQRNIILPYAYRPSIVAFKDLKKIHISNLKLETHHRGSFLITKTVTRPYVDGGIITIIEDENGNCSKLTVYNMEHDWMCSLLPKNSIVAIKEPYCKVNGDVDYVVRVDHPSDLHIWTPEDRRVPESLRDSIQLDLRSAREWKVAGDTAFLAKDNLVAIKCYTRALQEAPDNDQAFHSDVLRRRANINYLIKRFDDAREDALGSRDNTRLDSKAYHSAARAAYELGTYKQCKTYLERALKISPNNVILQRDINRTSERMKEQTSGGYDFVALSEFLGFDNNELDCASFTGNTEVRDTATHGRGLFVTKDIEAGDLILCDKALHLPNHYGHNEDGKDGIYNLMNGDSDPKYSSGASLLAGLITKLYKNPSLNSSYLTLYAGDYEKSGREGTILDGAPIVDVFLIECIRQRNCFSAPLITSVINPYTSAGAVTALSRGFWTTCSYMNHCCVPNSIRTFMGNLQIVRATCDIPAGTELTTQYIKPDADLDVRHHTQIGSWGFACDCWLCVSEGRSTAEARKKRNNMFSQAQAEAMGKGTRPSGVASSQTARTVEKMTRQLENLYEPEIYTNLPRLLLVQPCIWLTETYRSRKNYPKMLKYALATLRNFGLLDPVWDENQKLKKGRGMINIEAVRVLHYAAEAYSALGNVKLEKRCKEEAKMGYVMITGSEIGIESMAFILGPPQSRHRG